MYFSWFTVPSTTMIAPNLSQKKYTHTINDPPPYFTVGATPTVIAFSFHVLLTLASRDPCHSWIEHSSDHTTRFQSFNVQPSRDLHHSLRAFAFFFEMNGLRIAFLERRPRFRNFFPMVSLWTLILSS